jgi:isoleucyl-tRNA synthetase
VFGDWEHPYLTMDPKYEAEILRAFAVFVEKGLVYQAQKPVFWSTGAQTALAEAEVEYQERDDTAVYVRFPLPPDQLVKIGLQLISRERCDLDNNALDFTCEPRDRSRSRCRITKFWAMKKSE